MLYFYMSEKPLTVILALALNIVCYMKILGKMGKSPTWGIIPVLGEMQMSKDMFRRMRSFWRPVIITSVLFVTSAYLNRSSEVGILLKLAAFIVYGIFLMALYWRLAKQFGKGRLFSLGLIFITVLFLPILAFGKSTYLGKREFRPEKERSPAARKLRRVGLVAFSTLEITALVLGCFLLTVIIRPIRPIAQYMVNEEIRKLADVTDSDEIVSREDTLGAGYEAAADAQRTREYLFPDHSGASKVVVMTYIIGSNLEDATGCASINIAQMKDATAKGDGVEFVLQTGGSDRWFTRGIKDSTVGRYVIKGGKLETAKMLDSSLCMSEPDNLKDFIVWTKENYPADRYMLVMWDHGGGFSLGFGVDELNSRKGSSSTVTASEVINAIRDSGVKFDLIGFDACLMQSLEYANALEPYADYYLASEETEPGDGWFYTAAYGKLAADPTLSTEDFAQSLISSYDQCYRKVSGEPQPKNTLSLVDLTLVKPAYEQVADLYSKSTEMIADNPGAFANLSAARSGSYQFANEEEIDVINFLQNLKSASYKQQVMTDEEIDGIIDTIRTCVVYRNKDSAEGINGIAVDFPYKDIGGYKYVYEQLKAVKYKKQTTFYNNFLSIMASQKRANADTDSIWGALANPDYSKEEWYVKGFENYDTTDVFIDIPVTETENGYLPELPEKTWDTILDCKVSSYLVTDDGNMYIGREHFAAEDAEGHPVVSMDDKWAHINGHLVCYETENPIVNDQGTIYSGTVKARLNGTEDITLHIEWDPVTADSDEELTGKVTGYSLDNDDTPFFMQKGLKQFESGDTVDFLFDFYDEEGNLKKTEVYGEPLRVLSADRLTVKDESFESGTELEYLGVLIDVYQRELMTEVIREVVE